MKAALSTTRLRMKRDEHLIIRFQVTLSVATGTVRFKVDRGSSFPELRAQSFLLHGACCAGRHFAGCEKPRLIAKQIRRSVTMIARTIGEEESTHPLKSDFIFFLVGSNFLEHKTGCEHSID